MQNVEKENWLSRKEANTKNRTMLSITDTKLIYRSLNMRNNKNLKIVKTNFYKLKEISKLEMSEIFW